jgi:hypothetical protein
MGPILRQIDLFDIGGVSLGFCANACNTPHSGSHIGC